MAEKGGRFHKIYLYLSNIFILYKKQFEVKKGTTLSCALKIVYLTIRNNGPIPYQHKEQGII